MISFSAQLLNLGPRANTADPRPVNGPIRNHLINTFIVLRFGHLIQARSVNYLPFLLTKISIISNTWTSIMYSCPDFLSTNQSTGSSIEGYSACSGLNMNE